MRSLRSLSLVAVLAVGLTLAHPRPARADAGPAGVGDAVLLFNPFFWGGLAVLGTGVVADLEVYGSLHAQGWAPRGLAIAGTVAWGLTTGTLLYLDVSESLSGGVNAPSDGLLVATAISVPLLALPVYGLAHGPPRVTVAPTAFRGDHGHLAPGLALSARF